MAVLEFGDAPELNLVYVEGFDRQHYIKDPDEVRSLLLAGNTL